MAAGSDRATIGRLMVVVDVVHPYVDVLPSPRLMPANFDDRLMVEEAGRRSGSYITARSEA